MTEFVLSLGTNLGEKQFNLEYAIQLLSEEFGTPIKLSHYYESEPWGFESENQFVNCCVKFKSNFSCLSVLKITQEIEKKIGRKNKSSNEEYQSRVIDIDIVYFGNQLIELTELTIPHRFFQDRKFVLIPLKDISSRWIDPRSGLSIDQLIDNCKDVSKLTNFISSR